jgi:phosphoserine phosphatase RsbU/P
MKGDNPNQPAQPAKHGLREKHVLARLEALATVFDLSNLFAGERELVDVLNETAGRVARVLEAKACGVRLLNEETGELVIAASYNLSDSYINKGPVLVRRNPIDAAALAGKTVYIEDASTDPRVSYPEQAKREGLVSGLCAPMTYRGTTVGVIRVYAGTRHAFTSDEEALLRTAGTQAAAGIIQARLLDERRDTERYLRQVRYAGDIQRRMIPDRPPPHPFAEFGCVYVPSLDVGGDFYDFIEMPSGHVGITIADVVGKGMPAALMMASVRSALRAYASTVRSARAIVSRVNRHMYRETLVHEFATVFYGVFSSTQRSLTYVNAGHDPPLLLRGDEFVELFVGGLVVGVVPDTDFEEATVMLEPGDVIVFYTDGVIDAMNFDGEHFGRQRLRESVLKHRDVSPDELAKQIMWDTRRFAGLAPQTDDITVVATRIR